MKKKVRMLETQGTITWKDIETALSLSQTISILLIRDMFQKGLIVKVGNGRNIHYQRG